MIGLLAAIAACALVPAFPASASDAVPLRGADSGSWGVGEHACGNGLLPVWVETAGAGAHVGRYAYGSQECANLGDGTYVGSFTMTAASGDRIFGSYAGTFTVDGSGTIHYEQTNTISGGSGRFTGASGSFDVSGLAFSDGKDLQTLSGAIARLGGS